METEPQAPPSLEAAIEAAVPAPVQEIHETLRSAGFRTWLVGGCVRDLILALEQQRRTPPKDWDLATDALPADVQRLFRRVIPTGIAHGTVTVLVGRKSFEVTTLRGERGYSDGRHPDEVFFVRDIDLDLGRRDFTVNAMAFDLGTRHLEDPFGGMRDLHAHILRAVGDPGRRFAEDGLRVMRCARFAATLDLEVESETRAAMRPSLPSFRKVAVERIREEWFKALASPRPSRALHLMRSEGLLAQIAPSLFPGEGVTPAFEEACRLGDQSRPDAIRRLALLCCLGFAPEDLHAPTCELAQRLKLSGDERKRLLVLVDHSAPPELPEGVSDRDGDGQSERPEVLALRRWMRNVGRSALDDVLGFLEERLGPSNRPRVTALRAFCAQQLGLGLPLSARELAVSGKDLMEHLGRAPGPWLGELLSELLSRTLEDPRLNQKPQLLSLAEEQNRAGTPS